MNYVFEYVAARESFVKTPIFERKTWPIVAGSDADAIVQMETFLSEGAVTIGASTYRRERVGALYEGILRREVLPVPEKFRRPSEAA